MTAAELVKALGGRGDSAPCPVPGHGRGRGDRNFSLSVHDGNDGRILARCHAGCSQTDVWAALKDRGLVPDRCRPGVYVRRSGRRPPNSKPGAQGGARRPDQPAEAKSAFAKRIWAEARPAAGTPVENYLKSRGLTIEPPATIRYHPGLKHGPTGLFLPAMVAAVARWPGRDVVARWPGRDVVAVHRTFLVADGRKKAPVSQNKMMLGPCTGGAVRFEEHGAELVLAERLETALSVLQATGKPVWACLSTSGLKAVILPPEVKTVIIAADGDEAGEKAAQEAARRLYLQGRELRIARPPAGMDFNDLLMKPENVIPFPREAAHG